MVIASDFSGLAYLAVVAILVVILAAVAWAAVVWWGTSWLLSKRAHAILTGILGVVPLLIAASALFGYPGIIGNGLTAGLLATWMLIVARLMSLWLGTATPSVDRSEHDGAIDR